MKLVADQSECMRCKNPGVCLTRIPIEIDMDLVWGNGREFTSKEQEDHGGSALSATMKCETTNGKRVLYITI